MIPARLHDYTFIMSSFMLFAEATAAGLGDYGPFVNLGAVGLICFMFYQQQRAMLSQAVDDRKMFREELQVLHDDRNEDREVAREILQEIKTIKENNEIPGHVQIGPATK